jgi:hypothetical protein
MSSINVTELKELFKKNIVMDIDDLMKQTSSSKITVFRNLKDIGYTTSYNRNVKYYTLLEIAKFDNSGIFEHKGILFFRDGGIQELVIKEIDSSEKGYTSEELSNKIRTRVSNQLHQFVRKGLIIRKKYTDLYVYYSIDNATQQKQISNREKELKIPSTKEDSEIQHELKIEYGIKISDSGITHLSDNFLIYCRYVHELASARIKDVLDKRGGYILHIDATVEEDSDMVFVGMNSANGWILHSKKIKSESHEEIIPALEEIKNNMENLLLSKEIWEKEWHWQYQKYSRTNWIRFVTFIIREILVKIFYQKNMILSGNS